jgi:hypothetical protein
MQIASGSSEPGEVKNSESDGHYNYRQGSFILDDCSA